MERIDSKRMNYAVKRTPSHQCREAWRCPKGLWQQMYRVCGGGGGRGRRGEGEGLLKTLLVAVCGLPKICLLLAVTGFD